MNRNRITIAILMCAAIFFAPPRASASAKSRSSDFPSVDKSKIYADGESFEIRGVAMMDDSTLWSSGNTVPSMNHIEERDWALAAVGDINTVRLAVKMDYFITKDGKARDDGFKFLDQQLAWAKKYKLFVILDMHIPPGGAIQDYKKTDLNSEFWKSADLKKRFVDGWGLIAKRYSRNRTLLAYELMNEPAGEPEAYRALIDQTVKALRNVDEMHMLIVQPAADYAFKKVDDDNVIYSFHYYTPTCFTCQNVSWHSECKFELPVRYPGNTQHLGRMKHWDRDALKADIEGIARVAVEEGVPVIIGEFAVSTFADDNSMRAWISDVVGISMELGFAGYVYWRQTDIGTADLSKGENATMAIINRGKYFSPAQYFSIRPGYVKHNTTFDAGSFYWNFKRK